MRDIDGAGRTLIASVGATVKRLRSERKISVTDLAKQADVSRRMLTAIEGGTANASLVTLDRVARALGVDFSALVRPKSDQVVELVGDGEAATVWRGRAEESAGRVFTTTSSRGRAEMWDWTLGPGDRYEAEPDPAGSEELLAVSEGTLGLLVDGQAHSVPAGSVAKIATDRLYSYVNDQDDAVRFIRVVVINSP